MEFLRTVIDVFLHLDVHLGNVISEYGPLTYALLFLVIFCETGLVVTPVLPGDSLLFAAGAFAGAGLLNLPVLLLLLFVAGVVGDAVNYLIGWYIGPRVFKENGRFLNREKLLMAQRFYEKHGGKAIVLARFMPFMRTLAPFVAGIGRMRYRDFAFYNLFGAFLWVGGIVTIGFLFGNIPEVKKNFEIVILGIIFASLMPVLWHAVQEWRRSK